MHTNPNPNALISAPNFIQGKILLFNREKGRRIRNANDIQRALVKEFGEDNVYRKIFTPEMVPIPVRLIRPLLLLLSDSTHPPSPHTLQQAMDFMRNVSIMITPHGANIGNTAFMLPGSALLEVQPLKCANAGKMHAYEHTSNVVSIMEQNPWFALRPVRASHSLHPHLHAAWPGAPNDLCARRSHVRRHRRPGHLRAARKGHQSGAGPQVPD